MRHWVWRGGTASLFRTCLLILGCVLAGIDRVDASWEQDRGYSGRSCGLDLDDDGTVGESEDDCRVCNGVSSDPDGDGIQEDLLYVDADTGSDQDGDGSPQRPYRTIQHAWNLADGSDDGAEDVICFRGIAEEGSLSPSPGYRGVPGTFQVPSSGSEARAWEYPSHPAMLIGWDADGDGCYPPYDDGVRDVENCGVVGDVAVLDGADPTLNFAFALKPDVAYLEMAHFELRDYGRFSTSEQTGFINFGRGHDPGHRYIYVHDLELQGINMGRSAREGSGVVAFNLFNTNLRWVQFRNLLFSRNGGWFARGVPHNGEYGRPEAGPIRWQNITRTMLGPDGGSTPGFKIWGHTTGVEILDSVWDTNVADGEWRPVSGGGWSNKAFMVRPCSRDWVIRNNEVIDSFVFAMVDGANDHACDNQLARPTDEVWIDRNIARNLWTGWSTKGHKGISIDGGSSGGTEGDFAGEVVGNVTITNNILFSAVAWDSCVESRAGNDIKTPPGRIVIANNSCFGRLSRKNTGALTIGTDAASPPLMKFMQQSYVIENNIFDGLAPGDSNVVLEYLPEDLRSDFNVFDPDGTFVVKDDDLELESRELASWRAVTGGDANSRQCSPRYLSSGQELRLDSQDKCAMDIGKDLSVFLSSDVDGVSRNQGGGWDIGASEVPVAEGESARATDQAAAAYWSGEPSSPVASEATWPVTGKTSHAFSPRDLAPDFYAESVPTFENPHKNADCLASEVPNYCCTGPLVGTCDQPVESLRVVKCTTRNLDCAGPESPYTCCTGVAKGHCCYEESDQANNWKGNSYCPEAVCPDGCVSQWVDQSGYKSRVTGHPITGRTLEQDDLEKPCFVADCINGHPCVRGHAAWTEPDYPAEHQPYQDATLEFEPADRTGPFADQGCPGPFYLAQLVRIVRQTEAHRLLSGFTKYDIHGNRLHYAPFGGGWGHSTSGVIPELGRWYLIEWERDLRGQLTVRVNERDVTERAPQRSTTRNPFPLQQFCNQKNCAKPGNQEFQGEGAMLLYKCGEAPLARQRQDFYDYLDEKFRYKDLM